MEYRSPLGYNFKLEQSLSAIKEEKKDESRKGDDFTPPDTSHSKKYSDFDNRRNSGGRNFYTPAGQRHDGWNKSPNVRNSQSESVPIEQLYHPSMLENPWEELERRLNPS